MNKMEVFPQQAIYHTTIYEIVRLHGHLFANANPPTIPPTIPSMTTRMMKSFEGCSKQRWMEHDCQCILTRIVHLEWMVMYFPINDNSMEKWNLSLLNILQTCRLHEYPHSYPH